MWIYSRYFWVNTIRKAHVIHLCAYVYIESEPYACAKHTWTLAQKTTVFCFFFAFLSVSHTHIHIQVVLNLQAIAKREWKVEIMVLSNPQQQKNAKSLIFFHSIFFAKK